MIRSAARQDAAPPHGVMFHHFRGEGHADGQGAITGEQLADMLDWLGPDRFLTPQDWTERAVAGRLGPDDLCLTFDDALLCQYEIAAPVLKAYGLTGFWFIYSAVLEGRPERLELYRHFRSTRFADVDAFYGAFQACLERSEHGAEARAALSDFQPERYLAQFDFYTDADRRFRFLRDRVLGPARYEALMDALMDEDEGFDLEHAAARLWMTEDHLLDLRDQGHVIGLHSYSHPTDLAALGEAGQRDEYARNHAHLTGLLGAAPRVMSHPCNAYDARTLKVLGELGIVMGFRSNLHDCGGGPLELPREDHGRIARQMGLL